MTIKKIMVFSQANEIFFLSVGTFFWKSWCKHDDQSALPSSLYCLVFLSSQRSNQRSKKRKPSKFHCESTQHIFKQLDLLQVPQKSEYVSSPLLPKRAKLKKKKKTSRANHSKLKLNEILEDLFYIAAHNLRTLQLRRDWRWRNLTKYLLSWLECIH